MDKEQPLSSALAFLCYGVPLASTYVPWGLSGEDLSGRFADWMSAEIWRHGQRDWARIVVLNAGWPEEAYWVLAWRGAVVMAQTMTVTPLCLSSLKVPESAQEALVSFYDYYRLEPCGEPGWWLVPSRGDRV